MLCKQQRAEVVLRVLETWSHAADHNSLHFFIHFNAPGQTHSSFKSFFSSCYFFERVEANMHCLFISLNAAGRARVQVPSSPECQAKQIKRAQHPSPGCKTCLYIANFFFNSSTSQHLKTSLSLSLSVLQLSEPWGWGGVGGVKRGFGRGAGGPHLRCCSCSRMCE